MQNTADPLSIAKNKTLELGLLPALSIGPIDANKRAALIK